MRPLAVLLLVLGSLAALVFALATLTGGRRTGEEDHGLAVARPPAPVERPAAELPSAAVPEDAAPAASPQGNEDNRVAVTNEAEVAGRKVAFGTIEGRVLTKDGHAVPEAEVGLLNSKPSALGDDIYALRGVEPPKPIAKVVTGEDGTFRFERLDPRKDWSLTVHHESYVSYSTELAIAVPEGGTWQEMIVLEPGVTCSGFVRDARTKQPIAGALLVVDSPFARMAPKKSRSRKEALTDATGAYSFENVGAAPHQARVLTISAPGYATQVLNNFTMTALAEPPTRFKNIQPGASVEGRQQDFELEPGKVIAGRVVSPERRGVPGIQIEALCQSGTLQSQGNATSGSNGEFLIEGLAEGLYAVRVTASHYDAQPLQRIEAGATDVLIELFEQATVTGKVVDPQGQPVSAFTVKARTANEVSKVYGSIVAQKNVKGSRDGTFELKGVPEGAYVIEADADGYAASFSDTISATQGLVTSDVIVRMTLGGSVSGIVLEGYSRTPVVGAEITTLDNDWMEGDIWEMFGAIEPPATTKAKVTTDSSGRFRVDLMTPGIYQVQIKAKGYTPFSVKGVTVVEGQNTELAPQVLIKGASIRGIVYGPDKKPMPGSSVQLSPADQSYEGSRSARADGNGRYQIPNVRPGTYQLSATRPNSGSGNPFEAIGDMRQSQIEVSIEDGRSYDFDLKIGGN